MFSLSIFVIPVAALVAIILIMASVKIAEQNSTIIFPMPIDIIKPFLDLVEKPGKPSSANGAARLATPDDSHAIA